MKLEKKLLKQQAKLLERANQDSTDCTLSELPYDQIEYDPSDAFLHNNNSIYWCNAKKLLS